MTHDWEQGKRTLLEALAAQKRQSLRSKRAQEGHYKNRMRKQLTEEYMMERIATKTKQQLMNEEEEKKQSRLALLRKREEELGTRSNRGLLPLKTGIKCGKRALRSLTMPLVHIVMLGKCDPAIYKTVPKCDDWILIKDGKSTM